jgi:hypothetical protein
MDPNKLPEVRLSSELQSTFDRARDDVGGAGDAARLAAIAARLGPALAPTATKSGPNGNVSGPFAIVRPRKRAGQAAIVAALLAACVALAYAAYRGRTRPSPPPVETPAAIQSAPAESPAALPVPDSSAAIASAEPAASASTAPMAKPRSASPSASAKDEALLEEHALLAQARRALDSSPSETLARVAEHQKRFPGGTLVVEREFLRISALARLGRAAQARAARDVFVAQWPRSAYRAEIDRLVGVTNSP